MKKHIFLPLLFFLAQPASAWWFVDKEKITIGGVSLTEKEIVLKGFFEPEKESKHIHLLDIHSIKLKSNRIHFLLGGILLGLSIIAWNKPDWVWGLVIILGVLGAALIVSGLAFPYYYLQITTEDGSFNHGIEKDQYDKAAVFVEKYDDYKRALKYR